MRTTRTIGALAVTGIAVGALVGCSSEGGSGSGDGTAELTVTWWGSEARIEMYEEAFAIFEDENPGVTITGVPMDYQSYWTARSTEASARELPDLMQFDPANLTEYANNGLLLDLTDYIGDTLDFSNVDEAVVASSEFDGGHFGIPIGTNTLGVFYNPALLEKAGVDPLEDGYTWEEFNEWTVEISAAGATNDEGQRIYGGLGHGISLWLFFQWLIQEGGTPFTEEGGLGFTQDDVVEFLELNEAVLDEEGFLPPERATQIAPLDGFAMEEAASVMAWDNYFGRYVPEVGDNVEVLPVPSGSDGEKHMFSLVSNMAIGANTEHPEEATELANFLAFDPRVSEIFGTDRGVNADSETRAAFETEEGSGDAKLLAYEESIEQDKTAVAPQVPGGFSTMESEWIRLNEDLTYGNITAAEFAEQWWAEAEQAAS